MNSQNLAEELAGWDHCCYHHMLEGTVLTTDVIALGTVFCCSHRPTTAPGTKFSNCLRCYGGSPPPPRASHIISSLFKNRGMGESDWWNLGHMPMPQRRGSRERAVCRLAVLNGRWDRPPSMTQKWWIPYRKPGTPQKKEEWYRCWVSDKYSL